MSVILVVDDSSSIRSLLSEALTSHGYEVLEADLVEKANEILSGRLPDLILLDVQLPDMDGRDFCRMLRRQTETRNIPVIIIAATETDKVQGFQAGADDYIMKPLSIPELVERVRAVLRRVQQPRPEKAAAAPAEGSAARPSVPAQGGFRPSWIQAASGVMLSPGSSAQWAESPRGALPLLAMMLGLVWAGFAWAPGSRLSPAAACGYGGLLWVLLLTASVVSAALLGAGLGWKEGSRILSLAGLPIVLKLLGGAIFSFETSLSPVLFSASPALLLASPPGWMFRLDLFELWSAGLLAVLLKNRMHSAGKAIACATVVWVLANMAILAAGSMVSSP